MAELVGVLSPGAAWILRVRLPRRIPLMALMIPQNSQVRATSGGYVLAASPRWLVPLVASPWPGDGA